MPRKDARARSPSPPQPSSTHRSDSPTFTPKGYAARVGSPPAPTQKPYTFFGISVASLFSLMSIAMVLANKCVVAIRPGDGSWMLVIQVAFTAVFMASYALFTASSSFNLQKLLSWAPCAVLFTANIVTSVMALEYITVPTFSVLRNVQPFIATVLGLYLLPLLNPSAPAESTSYYKLYALLLILIGTGIYAWKDIEFNANGYLWVLAHICSMSLYVSLVKSKGSGKDALPSSTMSLYVTFLHQQHAFFTHFVQVQQLTCRASPGAHLPFQCAPSLPASHHFCGQAPVRVYSVGRHLDLCFCCSISRNFNNCFLFSKVDVWHRVCHSQ